MCLVTPGARSRTLPESHRSPHLPARRSATGSTDAVTESSVEEPKRGFATTPETPRKDSASGPRSPSPTRVSTSPSPSREAPERCSPTRRARYARADSRSASHRTPSTGPVSPQPSRPRGERQPPKRACGTDSRARTCETRANAPQRSKRGPDTTSRARGAPSASHHRRTFCAKYLIYKYFFCPNRRVAPGICRLRFPGCNCDWEKAHAENRPLRGTRQGARAPNISL